MSKLINEIRQWAADYLPDTKEHGSYALEQILSRHEAEQGEGKPTEPLEELAKRKDKRVSVCVVICDNELFQEAEFGGERAARAYLEGLPTKAEKGGGNEMVNS